MNLPIFFILILFKLMDFKLLFLLFSIYKINLSFSDNTEYNVSIFLDEKYEPIATQKNYKVHMKLIIRNIEMSDYGLYKCISKNSIGETDGTVNVYRTYLFLTFFFPSRSLNFHAITVIFDIIFLLDFYSLLNC